MMQTNNNSRAAATSRRAVLKGGAFAAATLAFSRLGWASHDHQPSIPQVRLSDGVIMPMLGFGTYGLKGDLCAESVADAITAGYRLIDTAHVYQMRKRSVQGSRKAESIASISS